MNAQEMEFLLRAYAKLDRYKDDAETFIAAAETIAQLRARLEKAEQDKRKIQADAVEWAAAKSGNMGSASLLRQYAAAIRRGEVEI